MKLEYLAEGSLDCPLLRLSNFRVGEAGQLLVVVAELASGVTERVEVHRQPFIEAMSGCQLTLIRFFKDQGIRQVGPSAFEYALTTGTWDNVAGLIEPFVGNASGFQWLPSSPGAAAVLLSASGRW